MSTPNILPRVSVIMPSYNSAQYLGLAIQSVINQTFTNWELLIFNDGSTDNTDEIVAPFLSDARIKYIKQENLGQPKTRNKGVRMSRGSLIALLDADDIWKPNFLKKTLAIFDKYPDVGFCGTAADRINPAGEVFGSINRKEFYGRAIPGLITGEISVGMSASVTRKEVFEKIGYFDEGFLPFSMDYDFWLRASLEFMFYNIEEKLVLYRTGHASISSEGGDKRRNLVMNIVIPRFVNEYGGSKYVKWYHVWKLYADCYFGRATGQEKTASKLYWLVRSLICCPMNRDALGALFRVFFPKRKNDPVKHD